MMKEIDFWNRHSVEYLEMAFENSYREVISYPDGYGRRKGDCGDTVTFYLTVKNGVLDRISFQVEGCLNTNACCNTVVKMAEGKTIDQAWDVTPEQVIAHLKTLPKNHEHCAELAVGGFYLALADCRTRLRSRPMALHGDGHHG